MAHVGAIGRMNMGPARRNRPSWLLPQVPGNGIQYEFTRDQYWLGSGLTAEANVLADTRTSDALFDNTAGVYSLFGTDVPAITARGLYVGGQATNLVPNNTYQGASAGGAFPAGWSVINAPGVVWSVDGLGTGVDGLPYIDVRISGTNSSGQVRYPQVVLVTDTYAITGNLTGSMRLEVLSATLAGRVAELNTSVTALDIPSTDPAVYNVRLTRSVVAGGDIIYRLVSQVNPGGSIDNRYRLSRIQLEAGSFASPPIVTAGASATRLADSIVNPNFAAHAATFGLANGMAALARVNLTRLSDPAARRIATFGTSADGAYIEFTAANTFKAVLRKAGADAVTMTSGTVSATGIYDVTAQFKAGAYSLTVSGGIAGDTDASAETLPAAIASAAYIGQSASTAQHLNGPLERLAMWGI